MLHSALGTGNYRCPTYWRHNIRCIICIWHIQGQDSVRASILSTTKGASIRVSKSLPPASHIMPVDYQPPTTFGPPSSGNPFVGQGVFLLAFVNDHIEDSADLFVV